MRCIWPFLAALVGALLMAGCASPPPLQYFTLEPTQHVAIEGRESLYVSRVQVPAYLDDNRIWVRPETHRVDVLPNARWAERLPLAITRSLRNQFGPGVAEATGRPRLSVDIQQFEAVWADREVGAEVVLRAAWRIGEGDARTVTLKATAPDRRASALVRVMSNQVAQLSKVIAERSLEE